MIQLRENTMDHRDVLLSMVRRFVNGEWSLSDFDRQFYSYYIEELPEEGGLLETERQFFARVQEKLDWTSVAPSSQDRRDGWKDEQQLREWLRYELESHVHTHG